MLRLPQALFIFCSRLFHFRILEKPVLSGGVNMKCEGRKKENKHKNEMRENDRSF